METLLPVGGLSLIVGSIGSVHLALQRRQKKFKPIAGCSLAAQVLGAVAALALVLEQPARDRGLVGENGLVSILRVSACHSGTLGKEKARWLEPARFPPNATKRSVP